jgi:hypothetical protein
VLAIVLTAGLEAVVVAVKSALGDRATGQGQRGACGQCALAAQRLNAAPAPQTPRLYPVLVSTLTNMVRRGLTFVYLKYVKVNFLALSMDRC